MIYVFTNFRVISKILKILKMIFKISNYVYLKINPMDLVTILNNKIQIWIIVLMIVSYIYKMEEVIIKNLLFDYKNTIYFKL